MNAISKITSATSDAAATELRYASDTILVSATDPRGVITYANPQFSEVSGYAADELMGAPHNLIRHPDTPKAVFYLIWESLKQGKPIYSYVKNRAKNGDYYWVFATITLTENGFLSARIKPSSSLFEQTKTIYAELIAEEAKGMEPEQSAALLQEKLQQAGFDDLADFSLQALDAEFKKRGKMLPQLASTFVLMDELSQLIVEMRELANNIDLGFRRVSGEPVNLRILAGRLEGAGAALGTISQNYDAMAKEMHELVGRLHDAETGTLSQVFGAIAQGRAALQLSQLLQEDSANPTLEDGEDTPSSAMLDTQHERLAAVSRAKLLEIAAAGKSIPDICRSLRRRINGLDVVKLLCKVESGRMRDVDSGLDGIIARLEHFHDNTDRHLADLSSKASQITQKSASL